MVATGVSVVAGSPGQPVPGGTGEGKSAPVIGCGSIRSLAMLRLCHPPHSSGPAIPSPDVRTRATRHAHPLEWPRNPQPETAYCGTQDVEGDDRR
ncbi:hypothetical protein IDVR_12740 [Intrasporangium sp. DVR]